MKPWLIRLIIRVNTAFRILFLPKKSWAIMWLDRAELLNLLKGDDFSVSLTYHQLHQHIVYEMLIRAANGIDFADRVICKAEFQSRTSNETDHEQDN